MTVTQKAERAIQAYLVAASTTPVPDASVFTAVEDDSKVLPCVIVRCLSAETLVYGLGVWRARVAVAMLDNADDVTEATHKTNAEALFELVMRDDLAALLNASVPADSFYVFGVAFESITQEFVERSWQSTMTLTLDCCPTDIDDSSPVDDPDLWLWVTSDFGVTYEAVTFKMRSTNDWLDQSGHARHLSSDINRYTKYKLSSEVLVPMPTGKPVIRFDPSDPGGPPIPNQWTPNAGILADLSRNCTVYMLLQVPAWEYPDYFFDGGNAIRANTAGISMQPNLGGRISLSSPLLSPTYTVMPTGAWFVLTAKFNGAASTIQVNNIAAVTGNPTDGSTIDPLWAILGGYTLGTYQAKFDLGACIISNSANSAAIQTLHKNYLAAYAGITI